MIYLHGYLRKQFGKTINSKVHSVSELMKAAEANRPGFRNAIDKDRHYVVRRGSEFRKGRDTNEEEVEVRFNEEDWHILPLAAGFGGGGGIFQTILGVVLMVVGYFVPGAQILIKVGLAMVLSGVASMLAPSPPVTNYVDRESPDKRPSYLFNGPLNRTAAGGAVPLIYGKDVFVGSIFASGSLKIGALS